VHEGEKNPQSTQDQPFAQVSNVGETNENVPDPGFSQPVPVLGAPGAGVGIDMNRTFFHSPNHILSKDHLDSLDSTTQTLDNSLDQGSNSLPSHMPTGQLGEGVHFSTTNVFAAETHATSQSIDGVNIAGNKIADCFAL
jgi:hypothetical protein